MHSGRCTKSNELQNNIELTLLLFCGEFLVLKDLNRDFVLDESCAFAQIILLLKARTTVDATASCAHTNNAVAMMWMVWIELTT